MIKQEEEGIRNQDFDSRVNEDLTVENFKSVWPRARYLFINLGIVMDYWCLIVLDLLSGISYHYNFVE
jgi:hypothetical protein